MREVKVYVMEVLTPILAPKHPKAVLRVLIERYRLREKYGDVAQSLDSVFLRAIDPFRNTMCVYITGSTLRSAIKEALGLAGKPTPELFVLGAYFNEEDVIMYSRSVTQASGVKTVVNDEAILPGAKGVVYGILDGIKLPIQFTIGRSKNRGFGQAVIREAK